MLARHRRGNVKLVGFGNIFAGRGARGGPIVATTVRRRPDLILKSEPGKGSFKNCVKVLSVFCCSGLDSSAVFYYQRFIVLFGKLQCRKCVSDKAPKAAKPHRGLDDATSALKRTIFSRAVQFCVFFFSGDHANACAQLSTTRRPQLANDRFFVKRDAAKDLGGHAVPSAERGHISGRHRGQY